MVTRDWQRSAVNPSCSGPKTCPTLPSVQPSTTQSCTVHYIQYIAQRCAGGQMPFQAWWTELCTTAGALIRSDFRARPRLPWTNRTGSVVEPPDGLSHGLTRPPPPVRSLSLSSGEINAKYRCQATPDSPLLCTAPKASIESITSHIPRSSHLLL
jgi:hypothetical protein